MNALFEYPILFGSLFVLLVVFIVAAISYVCCGEG
jgi:hypothetical protein